MSVCCFLAPNPISSVTAGDRAVVPRPEAAPARPWHALPETATCGADLQDAARADCGSQDGTSPKGSPRPPRWCLQRRVHTRRAGARTYRRIFASQPPSVRDATGAQIAPIWTVRVAIGLERTSALGSGAADTPAGRTFRRPRLCRCLGPGHARVPGRLPAGRPGAVVRLRQASSAPRGSRSAGRPGPPVQNLVASPVRPASGVRSSWWRPGIPGWLITTQPAVGLT
jgi:hypothetical protein